MSRYIDADALKGQINTTFWAEIGKIIDNAPSIDIVRCNECKHWDTADGECYADRGIYFPNANDFCSYGERRES